MKYLIRVVLGLFLLCLIGCGEDDSQSKQLLLTIEGDEHAKATIEEMIKENPKIHIQHSERNGSGASTEYSMLIVEPDSSKNYSILRVEPDPKAGYSMMFVDPGNRRSKDKIDPSTLDAILKELKKRKEESLNK